MHLVPDADVCTIIWLRGFDSFDYLDEMLNEPIIDVTHIDEKFELFKAQLFDELEKYDDDCDDCWPRDSRHNQRIARMAVVMAATSHLQITAEKHLKQLGFTQSGPFQKEKHSGSDLSIWIMPAKEFAEAIGYGG